MGKGVVVMVRVETATMVPQVSIAAVVGMAAPGGRGRGQEVGQAAECPGP